MSHKTKTRTYVLVMLFALGALFADRFLLTDTAAPAEAVAREPARDVVERVLALTPTGLPIPDLPFPRNLPDPADGPPSRDLFAFPYAAHDNRNAGRRNRSGDPELSDAASFASRNHLSAILSDRGLQIAVVNGLWLRTGQTLDACTLTRIEGTRAYFTCTRDEAVLDLAGKPRRP